MFPNEDFTILVPGALSFGLPRAGSLGTCEQGAMEDPCVLQFDGYHTQVRFDSLFTKSPMSSGKLIWVMFTVNTGCYFQPDEYGVRLFTLVDVWTFFEY